MTTSNEQFYDDEIAPVLASLAMRCNEKGVSFVASVEFGPDQSGSTVALADEHGNGIRMTAYAARCKSNVDVLFTMIIERAKVTGHSSVFLADLGVPHKPKAKGGEA